MLKICSNEKVENYHSGLSDVLDASTEISCVYDALKDREIKINDSPNYSAIKNLSIEKYNPIGNDKFIKYAAFISKFKQYVLKFLQYSLIHQQKMCRYCYLKNLRGMR